MAIYKTCDRCGAEIEDWNDGDAKLDVKNMSKRFKKTTKQMGVPIKTWGEEHMEFSLCRTCENELADWLIYFIDERNQS